eukprot:SAG31_NODE_12389_length_945_cov_1.861702_1_plen_49_part_00
MSSCGWRAMMKRLTMRIEEGWDAMVGAVSSTTSLDDEDLVINSGLEAE